MQQQLISPEELFLGQFYHLIHTLAEQLRAKKTVAIGSWASESISPLATADTGSAKPIQPVDYSSNRALSRMEEER